MGTVEKAATLANGQKYAVGVRSQSAPIVKTTNAPSVNIHSVTVFAVAKYTPVGAVKEKVAVAVCKSSLTIVTHVSTPCAHHVQEKEKAAKRYKNV